VAPAENNPISRSAFPWATLAVALLAGTALAIAGLSGLFVYDRALILQGQLWRAWTGHVVHYGPSHLFWNLAVFLPAGCWLERLWPCRTRWFYAVCPPVISAVLLLAEPDLGRYAGLSGVATGMLVLLAGLQLRRGKDEPAWFWWAVLALVAGKIVLELTTGAPLIVSYAGSVRSVPLAHLGGLGCGTLAWVIAGRKPRG
jgi:rhomboid family GlyGly-CTERM serine protease